MDLHHQGHHRMPAPTTTTSVQTHMARLVSTAGQPRLSIRSPRRKLPCLLLSNSGETTVMACTISVILLRSRRPAPRTLRAPGMGKQPHTLALPCDVVSYHAVSYHAALYSSDWGLAHDKIPCI